jgi:hypothetical protein
MIPLLFAAPRRKRVNLENVVGYFVRAVAAHDIHPYFAFFGLIVAFAGMTGNAESLFQRPAENSHVSQPCVNAGSAHRARVSSASSAAFWIIVAALWSPPVAKLFQ